MAYRNKEACLQEAERLGLDVSDMTWPELQKAVSKALALEELGQLNNPDTSSPGKKVSDQDGDYTKQYLGATVLLSPELKPERYRLLKYDEVLGDDYDVEERRFDIEIPRHLAVDSAVEVNADFRMLCVVAQSAAPSHVAKDLLGLLVSHPDHHAAV